MRIDSALPPTNPYHLARAYNLPGVDRSDQTRATTPTVPVKALTRTEAASAAAAAQRAAPIDGESGSSASSAINRLVAAVVPGRIDFSGDVPRASQASLAFYRHPADKNAAATGVQVGRSLDVSG